MPSVLHETLVEIFREHPELPTRLLQHELNLALPAHVLVRVDTANVNDSALGPRPASQALGAPGCAAKRAAIVTSRRVRLRCPS